ncbi:type IV secretory system conjugative DNA transfer family protein [Faecalibacterium sp. DFI.5.82]|nr:type IV secretory system conjugative DNA transfer family protein [Faecalibacterium sp. DFI.5.82]MCB6198974.1 type IV secretory system conjugative DNA transfer family protein [Lacrimispora saccharolytica]MCG4782532.1 type IV secretory system conjugative DNA transfer family protein [Acetatifactor sp. DFI.5.50]MDE8689966.1 type IV secretory system conjugative DNA transfer family protein [Faecalibacterium sp. DFI.5.82]
MKKQLDIKKLLILNLPYILMGLFATNFGEAWRMAQGADASQKALSLISVLPVALASWWPSLHPLDLLVGICCGGGLRLAVYLKSKNAKKYRHGMEYGSARWGTHEDIAPYVDPVFQNNVILTKTESLTMNSRPKDPKTARNKNVLVIGGSGSGKTRFWLKPNLMQMHSSYVVTDPKGTILVECGKMLQRGTPKMRPKLGKDHQPVKDRHGNPVYETVKDKNGKVVYEPYRIKVLNTINFKKSMHYNPFAYLHSEKDILKLVTTLIANTKGEGKAGDDFWVKAETLLYCALIGYIHYEAPVEEQNFATLIEFINAMEVREDDEEFKNPVDLMFDELEARNPNHFAVRQYKKYKLAAGKTAKSILISCGARLAVFDIAVLREVTSYDELELDTLGDRKTALFLIMSDTDDSFNFLISMCYTQLFNLLCEKADDVYGGRLPVHVRCLIDEAANIGQIPRLEKLVATIRSREISACLVLQAQSQLKAIYKDNADTIIGNMDTSIFLGGKEPTTLKELEAALGKETIDTYNTGESRGRETSHSLNYQKLGKSLMSQDELAVMDGGKCILQLRGVRPFLSDKYDITKHPNFKYTADASKKNAFDIEAFLSARLRLKPNDVCDVYEVDAAGDE